MARCFVASIMLASSSLTWGHDYLISILLLVVAGGLVYWLYKKPDLM